MNETIKVAYSMGNTRQTYLFASDQMTSQLSFCLKIRAEEKERLVKEKSKR